jgi:hypothetical protein
VAGFGTPLRKRRKSLTGWEAGARRRPKNAGEAKLYSPPPFNHLPLIVVGAGRPRSRSCTICGEAVSCGENRIASCDRTPRGHHDSEVSL